MEKARRRKFIIISICLFCFLVVFLSVTYSFINTMLDGTKRQVITAGNLELELLEDENNLMIQDAMPMYDEVGMIQEAFTFRLINHMDMPSNYVIQLIDITTGEKIPINIVKYGLTKDNIVTIDFLSNLENGIIDSGKIGGNQTIEYSFRLWIDSSVEDEELIKDKSLNYRIDISIRSIDRYEEDILNGCDPVLSDNLVPVKIENDGVVKKADITEEWYQYKNQQWANAVVLEDKSKTYKIGDVIPEVDIQSYFVWIPRYKYKLFNMGEYTSLTSVGKKEQIIEVVFETKNTKPVVGTKVGDYHSHPAFQAFDSNGFWVGKYKVGYKGATSVSAAQQNNSDPSNLVIKPSVYSWRNITIGNMFKVGYDYMRDVDSHMMKNTEWGAVAYLQHSDYGSRTSVRINNNNAYMTGYSAVKEPTCGYQGSTSVACAAFGTSSSVTRPYNTEVGYMASTTANITGVYDMSGNTYESVMGYNMEATIVGSASGIVDLYEDFFVNEIWNPYYDRYSSTTDTMYNAKVLGDATGEMGPFGTREDVPKIPRRRGSWYDDYAIFLAKDKPWFMRSGTFAGGIGSGIFNFDGYNGGATSNHTFRIVLSPLAI